MSIPFILKLFFLTLPVYFLLDLLWVGFIAHGFFKKELGNLMAEKARWTPAILFYFLYTTGVLYFVVIPALPSQELSSVLAGGALLGLVAYGTYELVNQSLIRGWSWKVVGIDIAWGVCITTLISFISFKIGIWLMG